MGLAESVEQEEVGPASLKNKKRGGRWLRGRNFEGSNEVLGIAEKSDVELFRHK